MGTLGEKLSYLKETKEKLFAAHLAWLSMGETFRERVNNAVSILEMFSGSMGYTAPAKTVTLANGTETSLSPNFFNCVVIPKLNRGNTPHSLPFCLTGVSGDTYGVWSGAFAHIDLSNIVRPDGGSVQFRTSGTSPRSLIFPDHTRLVYGTVNSCHNGVIFLDGVKFGTRVSDCSSTWFTGNFGYWDEYGGGDRYVEVGEGFQGTLYISKIPILAECLVNIINNLADMSGTTTTYTLNIGTDNLAKLTDEQIAIAEAKGWTVT